MRDFKWKDILPGAALGLTAIIGIGLAHLQPGNSLVTAQLFNPQLSLGEIIAEVDAAGGSVITTGAIDNLVVIRMPTDRPYGTPAGLWMTMTTEYSGSCGQNIKSNNI